MSANECLKCQGQFFFEDGETTRNGKKTFNVVCHLKGQRGGCKGLGVEVLENYDKMIGAAKGAKLQKPPTWFEKGTENKITSGWKKPSPRVLDEYGLTDERIQVVGKR